MIPSFFLDGAITLFFIICVAGIGHALVQRFWAERQEPAVTALFSLGLGVIAFSFISFFAGALRGYYPLVAWGILAGVALIFNKNISGIIRGAVSQARILLPAATPFRISVAAALLLFAVNNLISSYAPPTGDIELIYHYEVLKRFIARHGIVHLDNNFCSCYPLFLHYYYAFGMLLGGELVPKLLHWLFGIAGAVSVMAAAARLGKKQYALIAGLIFYTSVQSSLLSAMATVDFGIVLFGMLAFLSFLQWQEEHRRSLLVLTAVFAGFTLAIKYTGICIVLAFAAAVIYEEFRRKDRAAAQRLGDAVVFLLIAVSFLAPTLIKNYILAGNPLYPSNIRGLFPFDSIANSTRPAAVTFRSLIDWPVINAVDNFGGTGPLLAAFVPFLFMVRRNRTIYLLLALALVNVYLLILLKLNIEIGRLMIWSTALLSVIAGYVVVELYETLSRRLIGAALVIVFIFPNLAFNVYYAYRRMPVFLGRESREAYLTRKLPYYRMADHVNGSLQTGTPIAVLTPMLLKNYYYDPRIVTIKDSSFWTNTDARYHRDYLKAKGINYLIVDEEYLAGKPDGSRGSVYYPSADFRWLDGRDFPEYFEQVQAFPGQRLFQVQ